MKPSHLDRAAVFFTERSIRADPTVVAALADQFDRVERAVLQQTVAICDSETADHGPDTCCAAANCSLLIRALLERKTAP